jgi:cation:H+ antiporter
LNWLEFGGRPLWVNLAVFLASAVVVWIAGSRVARWADRFAGASGIGHATVGLVLLAGITSLPEVAVTLTAAASSPSLAVNNLLGSIAMQIAILAVADAMLGKENLTVVAGTSVVLLQVALNVLLLLVLAVALLTGDLPLLGAGAWTWGLLALYAAAIWEVSHAEDRQLWVAKKTRYQQQKARREAASEGERPAEEEQGRPEAIGPLLWRLAGGGLAILVAGFLLSRTGEAIAEQTGVGQSFFGAVFVAASTSLPEVSSVVAAVRLRRYEMAISDIFGTNLFNVGLVFLVDLVHPGKPVIGAVGNFALMASLLGALMGGIYLVGLIERRDRTIARMGVDSFAVLAVYLVGLALLYRIR